MDHIVYILRRPDSRDQQKGHQNKIDVCQNPRRLLSEAAPREVPAPTQRTCLPCPGSGQGRFSLAPRLWPRHIIIGKWAGVLLYFPWFEVVPAAGNECRAGSLVRLLVPLVPPPIIISSRLMMASSGKKNFLGYMLHTLKTADRRS